MRLSKRLYGFGGQAPRVRRELCAGGSETGGYLLGDSSGPQEGVFVDQRQEGKKVQAGTSGRAHTSSIAWKLSIARAQRRKFPAI